MSKFRSFYSGELSLDYSNELVPHLLCCYLFDPVANKLKDLKSNIDFQLQVQTSRAVKSGERCINFSGTSDTRLENFNFPPLVVGRTELSIVCRVSASAIGNDRGWLYTRLPGGADDCISMRHDAVGFEGGASSVYKFSIGSKTTPAKVETSANSQKLGIRDIAVSWKAGTDLNVYLDGKKDAVSFSSAGSGAIDSNVDRLIIGSGTKDNSASGWLGGIHYLYIFSIALDTPEIVSLYNDPYQLFRPRHTRVWVPAATGGVGQTVQVGQAVETDSAFSALGSKTKSLNQALETDSAQAITINRALTIGQSGDGSTTQPIARKKLRSVGQALSNEQALPVRPVRLVPIGQAVETSISFSVSRSKQALAGLAVSSEQALPITPVGGVAPERRAARFDESFAE